MAIISNFPAGGGGSKSLNNAVITLATSSFVYDGTEKNQQIQSVVLNGTTLHEGVDYLVTGNLATEAGTHTISVLGIMDYGGVATATWSIAKAQGSVSVSPASLSIQGAGSVATAQISATGDGTVSAQSSDSGVATVASFVTGSIVSVTDAAPLDAENVTVDIEPEQDLHGYDNPWPAGGGKNKHNPDEDQNNKWINNTTGEIESANGFWITGFIPVKAGDIIRSAPKGSARNAWYSADKSQATYFAFNGDSGTSATAPSDGFVVLTVLSSTIAYGSNFIVTINNADLTYAPYSNICPISGWKGANVTRTGVNVWDEEWELGVFNNSSGEKISNSSNIRSTNYIRIKPGESYAFIKPEASRVFYYGIDKSFISTVVVPPNTRVITAPDRAYYLMFQIGGTTYNHDISIDYPSTDTAYHPYQGTTYPISWQSEAGTVYGGTLDVVNGVLTVDKAMVDLGTLNWSYNTTYAFFTSYSLANRANGVTNLKSDLFKTTPGSWSGTPLQNAIWGNGSNVTIYVQIPPYDNVADFVQLVAGHQLVYELATPITYTLTPQQIALLRGNNALYADTGNTTLTYQHDIVADNTLTVTCVGAGDTTVTVTLAESDNYLGATATVAVSCSLVHIYGVSWDGTSTTAWTRTDDAADFTDPVPYVAGATSYGSPFDNRLPWSGMQIVEDTEAGTLVSIPKFWYTLTQNGAGMKIQIADGPLDGFHVSPAHMDRGDGEGVRDVVYIGRYHCASDYKSKTGVTPTGNKTRNSFRSSIHALGSTIWQGDFALRFTLFLLYLVEFADWNSQKKIGYGCGNNSATQNMGYTDSMPYHTGTTQTGRVAYALGTQYRYIEGLWDNVYDWLDGCVNTSSGLKLILNPSNYSDTNTGTAVGGTPTNGWPKAFSVKDVSGLFPLFIPSESGGSDTTYSCDTWYADSNSPCICAGGFYQAAPDRGLFCITYGSASYTGDYIGSRLMKLP